MFYGCKKIIDPDLMNQGFEKINFEIIYNKHPYFAGKVSVNSYSVAKQMNQGVEKKFIWQNIRVRTVR